MLCAAAKPHCVTKVSSLFRKSSRFAQIWFVGVVAKGLGVVVFNIEFCHYDNTPMLCSFSCFQNKQTNQKQQRIVTQSRNTEGEEWGWLGESFAHCERLWEELFVYGQLHLSGWDPQDEKMPQDETMSKSLQMVMFSWYVRLKVQFRDISRDQCTGVWLHRF